jgi:TatD DNase family protein
MLVRARGAGVEAILAIGSGTGPGTFDCALKIAEQHDWIYASLGIHPHEAKLATDADYSEMAELAKRPKLIAWGEIGLDYFYDHSPRDVQQQVFVRQMELARQARLPIIIHCRPSQQDPEDAWNDMLSLIEKHWAPSGLGGILHCFTGERRHAERALAINFMLSFAGNVSFPKAESIREVARAAPLDRMLIETDSPYLAPVPYRGKRCEPAFVAETARHIAELRGASREEIGRITTQNFYRFFNIEAPPTAPAPAA